MEDGRVAFIDFGIVGRFSPNTWSGVSRLADGVAAEDFQVIAEVRKFPALVYENWWLPGVSRDALPR